MADISATPLCDSQTRFSPSDRVEKYCATMPPMIGPTPPPMLFAIPATPMNGVPLPSGATFSVRVLIVSVTPAEATPANMWSAPSIGSVRKCRSGCAANTHPSITSRYSEAHSDRTVLLPNRSAIGPHTRANMEFTACPSAVNAMTTGRDRPISVSI